MRFMTDFEKTVQLYCLISGVSVQIIGIILIENYFYKCSGESTLLFSDENHADGLQALKDSIKYYFLLQKAIQWLKEQLPIVLMVMLEVHLVVECRMGLV